MKNNKLSILLITNQLIYGGAERYTVSVANELSKRGANVIVISRGGPMKKLLNKKVKHYFASVRRTDLLGRLKTILTIIYVSWKESIQIVHTQSTSGALAAKAASFVTHASVIKTAHGYPEGRFPSVARTLNYTTDKVVVISDWLSRRLVSFGLRREKARTILNGIDINKFSQVKVDKEKMIKKLGLTREDKIIVSVARVIPEKKFEQLIYWFPFVLARVPTARLLIVGDGGVDGEDYRNRLISHTKSVGLDKSVIFLKGTSKIADILSIADVFCTPAVGKGFAVLEAMSAGLPVVARKPRGIVDTVKDGVSGFLFAGNDWKSMVEKVTLLLENKKAAKELGKQGKVIASSRFTLENMVDKLEESYEKLITESSVRSEIATTTKLWRLLPANKLESTLVNE
ncbi:MAG: glycosyltransferase family 4 protein [bacterium]|nr:glycosyltransferase family 4 protein [bacterium]